jgi:Zn-dependent protease/predicted transcriptional regulator
MFFRRVTLFRFFGFDVRADASWIFLSIFIVWTLATSVFPPALPGLARDTYQFMGIMTLAGLIFSIIAHEVAHAVIAQAYHMRIRSITLFIFGGVAEMEGEPSHATAEFYVAIAGPIMSLLLALFFWAGAELTAPLPLSAMLTTILRYLGDLNMYIAIFNIIPAFPLDGGRALRALIWRYKNNLVLATRWATKLSTLFAYGLMVWGCHRLVVDDDIVSGVWMSILGLFVFACGAYAVRDTESRSLLAHEKVGRFMHAQLVAVGPDLTIADLVERFAFAHYQHDYPVVEDGRLVGVLSLRDVLRLDRGKWPWLHVATVMAPLSADNCVRPDTPAIEALDILQRTRRGQLMVEDGGRLAGAIEHRDLAAFLHVTLQIDNNKAIEKSR